MTAEILALLGLGVPALGYLARISHQLGGMVVGQAHHAAQLADHERRINHLEDSE